MSYWYDSVWKNYTTDFYFHFKLCKNCSFNEKKVIVRFLYFTKTNEVDFWHTGRPAVGQNGWNVHSNHDGRSTQYWLASSGGTDPQFRKRSFMKVVGLRLFHGKTLLLLGKIYYNGSNAYQLLIEPVCPPKCYSYFVFGHLQGQVAGQFECCSGFRSTCLLADLAPLAPINPRNRFRLYCSRNSLIR